MSVAIFSGKCKRESASGRKKELTIGIGLCNRFERKARENCPLIEEVKIQTPITDQEMNPTNDEPIPLREEMPAEENPNDKDPCRPCESKDALRDLGEAVKNAFQAGSDDARRAAKDAIPRTKAEFARGLHDVAYGLAYAVSFGGAVVRELTPESFAQGFEEGQEAGQRAAVNMMERRKRASAESSEESVPDPADCSDGEGCVI